MNKKSISTEKIKAALSVASMGVLSIQYFISTLNEWYTIPYIPLSITFLTIFINMLGEDKGKPIKYVSLFGFIVICIIGLILYNLNLNNITLNSFTMSTVTKITSGIIGGISLLLAILYTKRIADVE